MSLEANDDVVAGMEQAEADANLQYAMSLLHPFLVKLIQANPTTARKMAKKVGSGKPDFSQALRAIIAVLPWAEVGVSVQRCQIIRFTRSPTRITR